LFQEQHENTRLGPCGGLPETLLLAAHAACVGGAGEFSFFDHNIESSVKKLMRGVK